MIRSSTAAIVAVSLIVLSYIILNSERRSVEASASVKCQYRCRVQFVESIPTGLNFSGGPIHRATHETWLDLLKNATKTIHIAALYWNLNSSEYPTAEYGRRVYDQLVDAGRRGVDIRITQDVSEGLSDNEDSRRLAEQGLAQVRTVELGRLLGSGVLHTKFIIVDMKNIYVGSANMDWKSLTEVKELGLSFQNCACLAEDLRSIFEVYWYLGKVLKNERGMFLTVLDQNYATHKLQLNQRSSINSTIEYNAASRTYLCRKDSQIPRTWPAIYDTSFNMMSPMKMILEGVETEVFVSSSPASFNSKHREHDLQTIIAIISAAQSSVCVSVMDLIPQTLYMTINRYWPYIDNAIRAAAFRGVSVRLLVSSWIHSRPQELVFLRSLAAINDALPTSKHGKGSIQLKLFTVPATEEQRKISFARVNHNKYMVTDRTAYVGTSNWAGDYFINTAGVGVALTSHGKNGMVKQLQAIFERDWYSPYASDV